MAEYIKRKDVLQHKRKMRCADFHGGFWDFIVRCEDIKRIPAADVEEVRHGEWMPIVIQESYFDPPYCDTCKCSMCEYEIDVSETVYNYCPYCGAKMDGGGDGNG